MNVRSLALPLLLIGVSACSSEAPAPPAETETTAAAPAASASPRVFFVEPQDGATVKSPVHLVFGMEHYEIGIAPAVVPETARAGMGHHHVGVDIDCLPPGTEIVKANPWIHHGGGQTEMDMQLPPGQHKLTLQLGDDRHYTLPGLCSTITVNVVE